MSAVSLSSIGLLNLVLLLSGGGLFGLPPGARDDALVRCPPASAVFYLEWSERGTGKAGQPGIDGLAADPEIRQFVGDVERAIIAYVEAETAGSNEALRTLGKNLPGVIRAFLTRPGCLYLSFDVKAAQAAADRAGGQPSPADLIGATHGALIVNGGEQADAIEESLRKLLVLLPEAPKTSELKNVLIPLPGFPGKLTIHRHEKHIIAALGVGTVDQVVAGLSGKSKGLLENPRFVAAEKQVHGERTVGLAWLDIKTAFESAAALGPQAVVVEALSKTIGVDQLDSIVSHTGVVDGQIRSNCLMTTGGRLTGIFALTAGRGIEAADVAHVPADADLVAAVSLNASTIHDEILKIVAATSPDAAQRLRDEIKRMEDSLGFRLKDDLFAAFGDVWSVYDSPAGGGLFVTSLVAGLEVRDAAKAKNVFERMMKLLKESLPGLQGDFRRSGALLEERKFLDQTIYFVNTIGGELPIAPAFCLTEKHLLAALHPQALKAHLRSLREKTPTTANANGPESRPGATTIAYFKFDTQRLIRSLYPFAPYVGQMICGRLQREGVPLDVFSLPSARAVLPYVGQSSCTVRRTEKGILIECRSTLPSPGISTFLLGLWFVGTRPFHF